ncbi:MAG: phage holin family protein [Anaerolineae bacterium]
MIGGALVAIGASLLALMVVSSGLFPGIYIEGRVGVTLVVAALVLCALNALVRPILRLLTCPWVLVMAAFVLFVLNALLLILTAGITSWLSPALGGKLIVTSFGWAVVGGLVISIVVTALTSAYDWWVTRVKVAPPPDIRVMAQAQRAELDRQFDEAVQSQQPPNPPQGPKS